MKLESSKAGVRGVISRLQKLSTGQKVTGLAIILIVLQTVIRGWFISHSWFFVDDYSFLSDIATGKDNAAWYFHIHQGHFMPLSFVLVKIVALTGPFNWTGVTVEIILLQLLASLACLWMLRTLFGNRPAILLPLGFYLFSALTMPSVLWWAVAINQLPSQIACFAAIAAHVQFLRSQRWRDAFLATAFLIIGYTTYTKTLFIPPILVLLALMYFSTGPFASRIRKCLVEYWKAWLSYAIVTGAFLATYVSLSPSASGTKPSSFLNLAGTSILETFGTSLVGGPWQWTLFGRGPISYAAAPDLAIVITWLLIAAFVFLMWTTRERTLRALLPLTFYLVASILTVYFGRGYVLQLLGGAAVGRHLQYLSDSAPIVVLTIALMIMGIRGAVESSAARSSPLITRIPKPLSLVTVAVALLAGALYSSVGIARPWNKDFAEQAFTQTAISNIRAAEPLFADTQIPEEILSGLFVPTNEIKNYFAPLGSIVRTTRAGTDLKILRADGSATPAILDGPIRTKSANPGGKCVAKVAGKITTIPFVPVFNYPFWMAIDYESNIDARIPLDYGYHRQTVPLKSGTHTLFIATTGTYDSITLRPLVGQSICIKSVKVGGLVPQVSS